jgi:hypothetical protein
MQKSGEAFRMEFLAIGAFVTMVGVFAVVPSLIKRKS